MTYRTCKCAAIKSICSQVQLDVSRITEFSNSKPYCFFTSCNRNRPVCSTEVSHKTSYYNRGF